MSVVVPPLKIPYPLPEFVIVAEIMSIFPQTPPQPLKIPFPPPELSIIPEIVPTEPLVKIPSPAVTVIKLEIVSIIPHC
jgi:hypothetical protein